MSVNKHKDFDSQLEDVLHNYSNLAVKHSKAGEYLKGVVDVRNDEGEVVGSFLIEIHNTSLFPYRFPILYETGGSIPNEADWHKYPDGSCCITVEAAEILECKTGITLSYFINKHVIAFLANYIHRKETGYYKNGDYGHYIVGPFEFYSELLKTEDFSQWLLYFKHVFRKTSFANDRNVECFCRSGQKYKKCHKKIFDILRDIGEKQILKDFNNIFKA